ncbi:MAG: hypothetical protein IPN15_07335 [Saprospiraceae bacterium]|nr:hypothetical protein [Candidatus Vicinibacter affinis]
MTAVNDHSEKFIRYMDKLGISLGDHIEVVEVEEYDVHVGHHQWQSGISDQQGRGRKHLYHLGNPLLCL